MVFKLQNSGRVIRKVDGAPSFSKRNWKPPTCINQADDVGYSKLHGLNLLGEVGKKNRYETITNTFLLVKYVLCIIFLFFPYHF